MCSMPSTIFRNALLLALITSPAVALGGVYKCLDQNNKTFYQDKPCRELTSTGLSPELSKLAPAENRHPPLWKLVQGDHVVFLMAGLNFGAADMYPLPESVMDAFTGSAVLMVERSLDIGNAAVADPIVQAKGTYSDGTTLENHVKPATWLKALNLGKTLNITEEKLGSQKPWLAALTLKNAALQQAGYDPNLSVDRTFAKAAETLKPIIDLGSPGEQAEFVDGLSGAEQEQILLQAIRESEADSEYFKSLAEAWKKGDGNALEFVARPDAGGLSKSEQSWLEKQQARTQAIARKISEMSADGRTYFIVVDAKSLFGEKGLIAALQSQGFTATQI